MRCTQLAANTGRKSRHLGTIAQVCRAISSQLRHISTIWKKNLLKSDISVTCCHNLVNFGPYNSGWDRFTTLGHVPSKFQSVSVLGFVNAPTSLNEGQPNFARCLAVSWTGTLYTDFRWLLSTNGILPRAKFTLRPSLDFSNTGNVTARRARHSNSGCLPNRRSACSAICIEQGVGNQPTF